MILRRYDLASDCNSLFLRHSDSSIKVSKIPSKKWSRKARLEIRISNSLGQSSRVSKKRSFFGEAGS
jgi:hypothetical protein